MLVVHIGRHLKCQFLKRTRSWLNMFSYRFPSWVTIGKWQKPSQMGLGFGWLEYVRFSYVDIMLVVFMTIVTYPCAQLDKCRSLSMFRIWWHLNSLTPQTTPLERLWCQNVALVYIYYGNHLCIMSTMAI